MTPYRQILRLHSQGISQRNIAVSCACSRNTVAKVIERAAELGMTWPLENDLTDGELRQRFFGPSASAATSRRYPDYEYVHKEMAKSGVTLSLLWSEYCESCRLSQELPLMYSQFCHYYQQYAQKSKATMRILRKPGEQLEVDWAGQTAAVIDRETGEMIDVYIFVGVLSYSQYAYVEAFASQDQESWIAAHVNMYQFFGGATRVLIPDNLKTGVEQSSWYTPVINKTYQEMAEHYNTAVIPARVRKPKDKANVEGAVGVVSTWVIAALRKQQCFSLAELNEVIREKRDALNVRPFQKKEGSRRSVFLAEEKPLLLSLPATPYELATWKVATVQFNYHISLEKMNYSVPYEYIKHRVDVRLTRNVVEVFFNHHRICSHPRLHGHPGQYSTQEAHMPQNHKTYIAWDADRFVSWAKSVGPQTTITVRAILSAHKVEQQGYRSCMALLKLADKHGVTRLEAACAKALSYTPNPSFRSVKTILATGQDRVSAAETAAAVPTDATVHGFTRGANYYGRE
ncbi:IS21 family transposase [Paenibacillus cymbidii]|uniref:IS21 family transposase n=1 Tax=Paenibacillus cymbidii TaxID=1639034 RepID=UPI001081DECC|nr:IS21 family transposase [Paenibacillus cymbidii]